MRYLLLIALLSLTVSAVAADFDELFQLDSPPPVPQQQMPAKASDELNEDTSLPHPARNQRPEYYAALARVQLSYGLYGQAEQLQLRAIQLESDTARKEKLSYELFDRIYCAAGWWDKAASEIERTISLVEKSNHEQLRKYQLDRARVLAESGKVEEQIKSLEIVIGLSRTPDEKTRALRALHSALKRLDKLQEKVDDYEEQVKYAPSVDTLLILADIYYGSGLLNLPGKAIEKFEQVRKLTPDDVPVTERLARLYADTAQPAKAVALYEHLLKINSDKFSNYFNDALSLVRARGNDNEAIEWCERLRDDYPRQAEIPVKIGNIYNERNDFSKAIDYYEQALPLLDRDFEKLQLYFRIIECQLASNNPAGAEASAREAQKLDIRTTGLQRRLTDYLNRALELQNKRP